MSANFTTESKVTPVRGATLLIAGLETIATFVVISPVVTGGQLSSGEALSRSLGWAVLTIYGLPFLIFAAPALVLAVLNRHLPLALCLSLLMMPAVWLFRHFA